MAAITMRNKPRGFTLIELMIVLVILGILAAIAWPQYTDFIRKSRRADAQADLSKLTIFMERYLTSQSPNTYTGADLPFTSSERVAIPTEGYGYTLTGTSGTTYLITATPVIGSDQASDVCGTMTINAVGTTTPAAKCWQ